MIKPSIRMGNSTDIRRDMQQLFGCILAMASTAALVMTLQAMVSGTIAKTIAIFAGIALQGCLYLFSSDTSHRIKAFAVILLALSVCITTWYMESTWQEQQAGLRHNRQQQTDNSWQAGQYRQQIDDLNRRINTLLTSADKDIRANYRSRGLKTNDEIDQLTEERNRLLQQLNSLISAPTVTTDSSLFEQSSGIRLSLFFMIALLIDTAAMIALANNRPVTVDGDSTNKPGTTDKTEPPRFEQNTITSQVVADNQQQETPVPAINPMDTILTRIRAGDYGEYIPVKQIIQEESVRHPELKAGLDQLLAEGILEKDRNRYRMASLNPFSQQAQLSIN